ncbi:MAG: hypothetical protein ACO1NY_15760 [Pseudorhodoplanes sp.]
MTIYRWVLDEKGDKKKDASGQDERAPVADFSYQNDALAEMIVEAWSNERFKNGLLTDKAFAKTQLAERGIYLQNPVIIDEETYWRNKHTKAKDDEVVFVLPDKDRTGTPREGHSLLETARLLMACVPNGI